MVTIKDEWVEFSFYRPQANQVHLAGDFNDWRDRELPMVKAEGGYWTATMRLPAGEFKFRYCADGEWFTDYAAFGVEPGRFGLDSVVRVPQFTLKVLNAPRPAETRVAAA
jgi:1,4-alpha-glucan branching enzyme